MDDADHSRQAPSPGTGPPPRGKHRHRQAATSDLSSRPGVGRSRNLQLGPPILLAKGAEVAAPGYLQDPRGGRGMPVVCV